MYSPKFYIRYRSVVPCKGGVFFLKKTDYYTNLADKQVEQLAEGTEYWKAFLSTAGRMYKYRFQDQLLIHAQKPDAVACTSIKMWNRDEINRYVNRGTKGIAILDSDSAIPRLKYIFDVYDTSAGKQNPAETAHNPNDPDLWVQENMWAFKPEHDNIVTDTLAKKYDLQADSLENNIKSISQQLSSRFCAENELAIENLLKNSIIGLGSAPTDAFQKAIATSTAHIIALPLYINTFHQAYNRSVQTILRCHHM